MPNNVLWEDITSATAKTIICHENDPKWRNSILNNEVRQSKILSMIYSVMGLNFEFHD